MKITASFIAASCFLLLLSLSSQAVANSTSLPAWAVANRPAAAPLSVPAFDKLHSDLQQTGSIRVIVRLRDDKDLPSGFIAEGNLSGAKAIEKQRKAIAKNQGAVEGRLSAKGKTKTKKFGYIPFMALDVDAADFQTLLNSPEVDLIEEDIPVPPTLSESVPLIGGDGSGTFSGYTGSGQTVAILDTGVATSHPVFSGKIVSEACYSTTVAGQSTSVCPTGQNSQTGSGAGVNCNTAITGCDHGTHVANIAAGSNGVAKNANIIAIQIFANFSNTTLSWSSDQILGLERVYALRTSYNISSVNMSLGGGGPYSTNCDASNTAFKAAVDNLRAAGIATLIASGNNGYTTGISSPGCVSTAISVGATTKTNTMASYSNSSSLVTLLAPGSSIYAAVPGNSYAYKSGTSMATPHVTGAWAVMKSRKPNATVDEVLTALTNTGVTITDSRNEVAKPRIKLDSAVTQIPVEPRLQFSSAGYSVNENSGTATITVRRDISSTGVVSVDWATSDGTATAGADYTAASGTITFAAGESGDKTFTITIIDDALGEPAETINLALSNAAGGAVLGTQSAAVLTINADIGDLVNDGKPDYYWHNTTTGEVLVMFMDGTTRIAYDYIMREDGTSKITMPSPWSLKNVQDLNGDGKFDLLWHNPATGEVLIMYLDGITRQSLSYITREDGTSKITMPSPWALNNVQDFNGDNKFDLLWHNTATGEVLIMYMNGTGRQSVSYITREDGTSKITLPSPWSLKNVQDLNGDGKFDLLWHNPATGEVLIMYLNGTARQSLSYITREDGTSKITMPSPWALNNAQDFNGDNKFDLLWRNTATGEVLIMYMNGTTRQSLSYITREDGVSNITLPSPWALKNVQDLNCDGKFDLLWHNPATGEALAMYLNGTTRQSLSYISREDGTSRITMPSPWDLILVQ